MKISISDFILIFLGYGISLYEIFIEKSHRISNEISGILSFILSTWISISYVKGFKSKQKPKTKRN